MSAVGALAPSTPVAIVFTFVAGLAVDRAGDLPAQAAVGLWSWGLLLWLLGRAAAQARRDMIACLVLATLGEIFLSLVWGLYTYRLENVPHFIPPGHVFLYLCGTALATRLGRRAVAGIYTAAVVYAAAAFVGGWDAFALPLVALLLLCAAGLPGHRALIASTFALALGLELYVTALGNWTWAAEVPIFGLATSNPPAAAGAFYAALDALVVILARLTAAPHAILAQTGRHVVRPAKAP